MIFNFFGFFFLLISNNFAHANTDICKNFDFSSINLQTKLINGRLLNAISEDAIQKRRRSELDSIAAKRSLILGFNEYFRKSMNWNFIEIESKGERFYTSKCSGKIVYVLDVPMENIKVIKLEKTIETPESELLDKFSNLDLQKEISFDEFK
jgi:hypothetical protein